jgi:hypothetical protein
MAHYYIHLDNGCGYLEDEIGADYANAGAARERAINAGAAIIADELNAGQATVALTLFVEDADHGRIFTIPMSAAVADGAE